MSSKTPRFDICPIHSSVGAWDTSKLFSSSTTAANRSAVDEFHTATTGLNVLLRPPSSHDPLLGHLVLLGHMSAVESYFRTMIRRVILIDPTAQDQASSLDIAYAAAVHHKPALLPEALFEGTTFVSKKGN